MLIEHVILTINDCFWQANFAVERFSIKRESFAGIGCFWYSEPGKVGSGEGKSKRTLHCSTTNTTIASLLGVRDKVLESGIQVWIAQNNRYPNFFYYVFCSF